jgi:succinoglycan biosynthesis transport protein ExoP
MSISQILAILRARWVVALSVMATVMTLTAIYDFIAPRKYTSSASIMVDVKSPDPVAGMVLPAMMTPSYMATLVDLLISERVALRVVRSLRLNQNPQLMQTWRSSTNGKGDFDSWVADSIGKGLDVKPSRESNIISISYTGADPAYAAALCNAFVDSYISTSAELRMEPAKQYNTLFEGLNNQLRERLEKAQTRLSTYQREHGLVATDERMDIEMGRMGELSSQVTQLQAMVSDSSNRKAEINARTDQSYEVLNNGLVASLKGDLSRLEAKLEEAQQRYGDNHPSIQETRANIAALRQRIHTESSRVASSVGSNNKVNEQRLAEVTAALAAQRTKVLQMKALRDEASVMIRDVDNIQRAYDVVQARATQSRMESQATQTNLSVLKSATAPSDTSSPRIMLHMLLALFIGTLLSLITAIVLELLDRRIRTVDDVVEDMRLPLIGVLLKSADAKSSLLGKKMQPWLMRQYTPEVIAHSSATL